MFDGRDDATQAPTTMRLRRARQDGQFGKSRELVGAAIWGGGFVILSMMGGRLWNAVSGMAEHAWTGSGIFVGDQNLVVEQWQHASPILWKAWLPILGLTAGIAILVHAVQTEFRWFPQRLSPRLDRMSPAGYLNRVLSLDAFFNVSIGLLKLAVLSFTAFSIFHHDLPDLLMLGGYSLAGASSRAIEYLLLLGLKLSVAATLIGVLDYGVQRWLNNRQLRMTEQEVRDEQRSLEPPAEIGARQRLLNQRYRARVDDAVQPGDA